MKNFDTFQELWEYSLYCPFCKKSERKIDISISDEDYNHSSFKSVTSFYKNNDILNIKAVQKPSGMIFDLYINCIDNTVLCDNLILFESQSHLYFFADCKRCRQSWLNTNDMFFDFTESKKISNIGVENEVVLYYYKLKSYNINFDYRSDKLFVEIDAKSITLPIIKNDFSNLTKLCEKIDTMIVFS